MSMCIHVLTHTHICDHIKSSHPLEIDFCLLVIKRPVRHLKIGKVKSSGLIWKRESVVVYLLKPSSKVVCTSMLVETCLWRHYSNVDLCPVKTSTELPI